MFEVGFSELCMVALVALLVIGPEKLPRIARLTGYWLGKTRTMVANVKAEIKAELHAEEMRQLLEEQQNISDLQQLIHESEQILTETQKATQHLLGSALDKPDSRN